MSGNSSQQQVAEEQRWVCSYKPEELKEGDKTKGGPSWGLQESRHWLLQGCACPGE